MSSSGARPLTLDVAVVGSGPNGLAAALVLARAGHSVEVFEGAATQGGGCRTEELTLPGFHHDVCATVHAMLSLSPFFKTVDLDRLGVHLALPEVAFAHPLDGGRAGAVVQSVNDTAEALGGDGATYRRFMRPLVDHADELATSVLAPLRSVPKDPFAMARFAWAGLPSARHLAKRFTSDEAKALVGGAAAHSMLSLDAPLTGAFASFLTVTAHAGGWPVVRGGSANLVAALTTALREQGAVVHVGRWVRAMNELPRARATIFDTAPQSMVAIAGDRLPARYRRAIERFRHGPGVFKVDWALSGPVPWTAEVARRAGTVHVGGDFDEVARSEADVVAGRHPDRPFCLVVQPSVMDPTRAPSGQSTLWAYCHVPSGSTLDMTAAIEQQIERFAPGFKDLILATSTTNALESERHNPNYLGGDINGGVSDLRQTVFRPTRRWNPYTTGAAGLYLCSASTSPGGGVHGMSGAGAARVVLRDLRRGRTST